MSGRWRAGTLALVVCWTVRAQAYTLIHETAAAEPLHWPPGALPVAMRLNDQISAGLLNVAAGSDPLGAIQRALTKYPAVSGARFEQGTTSAVSGGNDRINIISFADTPANRQAFEMAGGNAVVGLTLFFFSGSEIVEADLLFNPALQFTTTLETDYDLETAGAFDVEALATHELGHVLGLHHSGVESATMWPLTSVLQRQLDTDDVTGVRVLYPSGGERGAIAGQVTVNGTAAFGAQVVARGSNGAVAASALTLPDGTYRIDQLAPDTYNVYVEPLDGPASAMPDVACVRLGNLSGAGIYNHALLTTDFPTRFADTITVTAGATAPLDFSIPTGAPPVNPVQIGFAVIGPSQSLSASIGGVAVPIIAGSDQLVAVAGPGMDQVPASGIDAGPGVHVDTTNLRTLWFGCNDAPLPALIFGFHIDDDAPAGGRSIVVASGSEHVAFTGAVRVLGNAPEPTATATPLPTASPTPAGGVCTGDCDGGGTVTINEIITLVNVALGSADISACAHGVPPATNVTVAVIIQAVNHALNSCP